MSDQITDTDGEPVSDICPEAGSPHVWEDTEYIWCELCGNHMGVVCSECHTYIDTTFNKDPREKD